MIVTVKDKAQQIVVPPRLKRLAGIKPGDRPTETEWAEIRKGETALANGDSMTLEEFVHGMGDQNRKTRAKTSPKLSR